MDSQSDPVIIGFTNLFPSVASCQVFNVVRFENVSLRYGNGPEILRSVDLSLDPGSFHFIVGPSGAGKSSLMKLMYLAHHPDKGRVKIFGRDTRTISRQDRIHLRRRIGIVFQDFRLLDHLNALENVALPLTLAGHPLGKVRKNVTELLNWVGLADFLDARPPTLSGGQQQRLSIARAVIARPSLLIADEPTGNVDEAIAERLLFLFEELNKRGTTIVLATHNDSLIRRLNYPVLRLIQGEIRANVQGETARKSAEKPG